jgi:hypothetical protein
MAAATDVLILDLARAAAFAGLPAEARALLRLCDGTRTVAAVVAASELPPARAQLVIDRLQRLGLIAPANQPVTQVANQDFTPEEEQFFASPIDHLVDEERMR